MAPAADDLRALMAEFYQVWFRFHPDLATSAGVAGYAGKMPAVGDDDIGALVSWLESTIVGLEEIDFQALDGTGQLDMELLFGACRDEYQAILACDWRHRDPLAFLPFRTICLLAADAGRGAGPGLRACLEEVPPFLGQARARLAEYPGLVPRIWLDAALTEGRAGVALLARLETDEGLPGLEGLCSRASRAVADFLQFLERAAPAAAGTPACGRQRFQEQLRFRHHLPDDVEMQLETARRIYRETRAELEMFCLEQTGSAEPAAWLEELSGANPLPGEERLAYARRCSTGIHRRLAGSGRFRLPVAEGLELRPAPAAVPAGCLPRYRPPAPGVEGSPGILYLERGPAGAATEGRITAWCIRNAWPGRHLQAAAAALSPAGGTLVRRLNAAVAQQIGWSLYAEQLMREQKFFPGPEPALYCLLERLRRSFMAVLDIELHVNGMAASAVLLELQGLPGHGGEEAARDLLWLTRHPTQALAGVAGWKLLAALGQGQRKVGAADAAAFHARLLAQGAVATPLVIRRVFGQHAWERAETGLYSQ